MKFIVFIFLKKMKILSPMQQQHIFMCKQCKVNGDTASSTMHAGCVVTLPAAPLQVRQFLSKKSQ
jgi:hypothetical protein